MKVKEKVYTYVELGQHTSIQKLSFLDQLRVILKQLTNDDAKELIQSDILTAEYLRMKANLIDFIDKATDPIRRGNHRNVKFKISSEFDHVLSEVLNDSRYTKYYTIEIHRPYVPYKGIKHFIEVRMGVKG